MSRQDFLDGLRTALLGKVSPEEIRKQVEYYDNYILSEVRKGRSEAEVLDELGDPRLIAKSIMASEGIEEHISTPYEDVEDTKGTEFTLSGWPALILIVAIALVIIWIVVKIAIFLMPVVLLVIGILAIVSLVNIL